MRENMGIFRGKRKDNGKWAEGYYLCLHQDTDTDLHIIVDEHGEYNPVDPETVGEFTGLTDKNGKRIFEGDIVENGYTKEKFAVIYDKLYAAFAIRTANYVRYGLSKLNGTQSKVVGNIHDNPELLEREC